MMKNIGFNENECRIALESYSEEIESLMALVSEPHSMTTKQIEQARSALTDLKSALKRDCKLRDTIDGRKKMTDVEASIYFPAVFQAHVDLRVTVNSKPSREWYSNLYDIRITIDHALVNLKNLSQKQ